MWSSTSRCSNKRARSILPRPWRRSAAGLVASSLLLAAAPALAAEVWIDVSKSAERKIGLAIPPLMAREGTDEETLRQVLENDLLLAGYFRVLTSGPQELAQAEKDRGAAQPDLAAWLNLGAELLLSAVATRQDGRLVLRAVLYDAGARTQLIAREESGAPSEAPRLAHRLADAVVRALTGLPSLALTRIAATWTDGTQPKRVYLMDYDGRNLRPLSAEGVLALNPTWFPDGSRVAYVTYRNAGRMEIVSQNVTSGQIRSLAFFPGMNASPAVSPDGRNLLLVLSRDGNSEVYRMPLDGTELKRLTFSQDVETSPAWSPDAAQIVLVSDSGSGAERRPQINLLGANGGRLRRVSTVSNYATAPDWSPRGDRIVFTALAGGTHQLFLLDPVALTQEQLTFDGENKENPSFGPDGRHVVCSLGHGNAYRLAIYDTFTGERVWVLRAKGSFTSPSWSR